MTDYESVDIGSNPIESTIKFKIMMIKLDTFNIITSEEFKKIFYDTYKYVSSQIDAKKHFEKYLNYNYFYDVRLKIVEIETNGFKNHEELNLIREFNYRDETGLLTRSIHNPENKKIIISKVNPENKDYIKGENEFLFSVIFDIRLNKKNDKYYSINAVIENNTIFKKGDVVQAYGMKNVYYTIASFELLQHRSIYDAFKKNVINVIMENGAEFSVEFLNKV